MKTRAIALIGVIGAIACGLGARLADGQSLTPEAAITVGKSSEGAISVIATQLRAFGEVKPGIFRYYVEGAWARSSDDDSDAFGAAYPYTNRFEIIEAYGEQMFRPGNAIVGLRAGRYRSPFGIYNASDHAYTGFTRAPLIRYGGYFALSNNYLEHGADLIVGVPRLTIETSLGVPGDVGTAIRRPGLDTVVRVQGQIGPAMLGVSRIRTSPYQPRTFARGRADFTGLDVRWMRGGVLLRGEWITGRPFDGRTTTGWYADAIVHRVAMGPVTAVARVEKLDYPHPVSTRAVHSKRQTIGARIRIFEGLSAQVNALHHTGLLGSFDSKAVDIGVTYSFRRR